MPNSTYKIRLLGANRETKPKFQDTIELNDLKENDNPSNFNDIQESEKILSSPKTILSNEELKYWNENGVQGYPRILVASERSDPAFNVNRILDIIKIKQI